MQSLPPRRKPNATRPPDSCRSWPPKEREHGAVGIAEQCGLAGRSSPQTLPAEPFDHAGGGADVRDGERRDPARRAAVRSTGLAHRADRLTRERDRGAPRAACVVTPAEQLGVEAAGTGEVLGHQLVRASVLARAEANAVGARRGLPERDRSAGRVADWSDAARRGIERLAKG